MKREVLALDPASYASSALHDESRVWRETNCAADFWIEGLNALGFDPASALGFTLSMDFDGDQWRMFKFPAEDLRRLFGIEVDELNVWRPLAEHLEEQVSLGRFATADVDAWHLPDTAGLTYQCAHQKTTVMVQMIDPSEHRLGYFHNTGYFELEKADYDALLGVGRSPTDGDLPPYVESVRLDNLRRDRSAVERDAVALAAEHLARRPSSNPLVRLRARLDGDLGWLAANDIEVFHRYAFGTVRQCGAGMELASSYVEWLGVADHEALDDVSAAYLEIANGMKAVEFVLARAARGRPCDLASSFASLEDAWDRAAERLVRTYGD